MPNTVKWFDERKNIIVANYHVGSSWEDFHNTFAQMGALMAETSNAVFVIHIVEGFPGGAPTIHIGRAIQDTPDQIIGSTVITVGNNVTNAIIRTFLGIAAKVYSTGLAPSISKDMEEAIASAERDLQRREQQAMKREEP